VTTLRAGISGSGALARAAVQRVRTHAFCDVVAAHEPDPAARAAFQRDTGIGFVTADFPALLATGIDFVILAGPCSARLEQVALAADQGVHCLLHAPMAPDPAVAAAMVAACERAQVKLGVAVQGQEDPVFEQLRAMVAADWLGGPVCVQALWAENPLLDAPPGPGDSCAAEYPAADPLLAIGAHHVHLATWLLGRPVVRVTAQGTRGLRPLPAESTAATVLFRGNVLGTFTASHLAAARAFAIHGTDGGLRLHGDRLWLRGRSEFHGDVFDYPRPGEELALPAGELRARSLARAIQHELHGRFARWIDDVDDFPCPGEQALEDQRVLDAIARAVASGAAEVP